MFEELSSKIIGTTKVGSYNESNRVEWLEKTLKNVQANSRILDAGAGEQQFKRFCTHLRYVSQDFAQYVPAELSSGLQMPKWDYGKLDIVSDIAGIPEPDGAFDAIMCTEVFEHIVNPREAVREFARLLHKDGQLIITAPFCSLTHFAPYHFYTGFNRFFYETELKNNGFEILEITPNGNYFEYVAQEVNRIPQMANLYAGDRVGRIERVAMKIVLKMLERFSAKNNRSEELLSYGLHVLARKL
ncbi:class I SAM-dependent methyltransferase [Puia sp.]|jgi:ubiquinone/menaquinone biosynthesis C-methylase UbiE|uniref:class I SAM-dependent methyltransferase n=1 Tax=Puia sp. TaxID=2045100 RepID=UPI002F3F4C78